MKAVHIREMSVYFYDTRWLYILEGYHLILIATTTWNLKCGHPG
jgi:hypothetical protein